MIADVYEPLARYRDEFRERFGTLTRGKFKELTERSGIDVRANQTLVAEIKKLQAQADSAHAKKTCYGCLMALGFTCLALAFVGVIVLDGIDGQTRGLCIVALVVGGVLGIAMIPMFNAAAKRLSMVEPYEVGVIALSPDVVAVNEDGALSLSTSLRTLAEIQG